jgi:hypothetical protein
MGAWWPAHAAGTWCPQETAHAVPGAAGQAVPEGPAGRVRRTRATSPVTPASGVPALAMLAAFSQGEYD